MKSAFGKEWNAEDGLSKLHDPEKYPSSSASHAGNITEE
jgi:hypothetical protein